MGQDSSKTSLNKGPSLNESEHELVKELLNCKEEKPSRISVKKSHLKPLWEGRVGPPLSSRLLSALFPAQAASVDYETFVAFYLGLVREANEGKAGMILKLAAGPDSRKPEAGRIVELLRDLLTAYFRLLTAAGNRNLSSWSQVGVVPDEKDATDFAKHLVGPAKGQLEESDVESLLFQNPVISHLLDTVLNSVYNLKHPKKNDGLLPEVVFRQNQTPPSVLLRPSEALFLVSSLAHAEHKRRWRLLFSTRADGASWSTLAGRVTAQGPTLLLVRDTEDALFGGFASESWRIGPTFYGNEECFLFSLRPELASYHPTGYTNNFQYMNQGQHTLPNGMGIGGQIGYWGLFLDSEFGTGRVSETCTTFRGYKRLSSKDPFVVRDVEIWGVGEPDPTPEELGERVAPRAGSALTSDPTAEAILEAAGKEFHSKGFQELDQERD